MKLAFWKKSLLLALCAALLCCMGVSAWAAETQDIWIDGEVVEMPTLETSAQSFSWFALDGNGKPALKEGNYERWIDRLDLADADYALTLYGWLEDNIGITTGTGALIDPTVCEQLDVGEYVYPAATITGTGTFTYTGDRNTDSAAAYAAVQDQINADKTEAFAYLTAAYSAFDRDHPEVFWLSGRSQNMAMVNYSYTRAGTVKYTLTIYFMLKTDTFDVRIDTYQDAATLSAAVSGLYGADGSVAQILSGAQGSRYEMVRYFNNWLTTHNCYCSSISSGGNDIRECISALTGSTGIAGPVCEGYARALKVLCDRVNIPCVLVDGTSVNSSGSTGAHMWNYVQMDDGNWYGVDVTWNDPTVSGVTSPVSGYERESYLMAGGNTYVGNLTFLQSHQMVNRVTSTGTAFTNGPVLAENAYDPTAVPTVVVPEVMAKSFSLSFEDEVLVNFYYTVSDLTDVTEHGMLVFYEDPGTADYAGADVVYTDAAYDEAKARYGITTDGIAAKLMGQTRYYAAYAKLSDDTVVYSTIYDYSPKKYAMNMLSKDSTSAKQKVLCVAMLNYGAAAQGYFGYKTDDLMNADLTAQQNALVSAYDSALFTGTVAAPQSKLGSFASTGTGFSKKSATVSFEGAFSINYYFTPNQTIDGELTLYYWTPADYEACDVLSAENASGSVSMSDSGDGRYWAQVSGIAAKSLDKTYYVAAVYTDADGNSHCTGVVPYSLSKYCMNNANGSMGALAQATAMYGYYAAAYFAG